MSARVMFYTRAGCHLCDEAAEVVSAVCGPRGVDVEVVDVDGDVDLRERYGDEVPVVTVDGAVVGFWRIDPELLAQALS
jgi:glutaredoxin